MLFGLQRVCSFAIVLLFYLSQGSAAAYSSERGEQYDNESYVNLIMKSVKRMDFQGPNQQSWPFLNQLCRNAVYLSSWHPVSDYSYRQYSLMRAQSQIIGSSSSAANGGDDDGSLSTASTTTAVTSTSTATFTDDTSDTNDTVSTTSSTTTSTTSTSTTSTTSSTTTPPTTQPGNGSSTPATSNSSVPPLYSQTCTIYNTAENYLKVFKPISVLNASAATVVSLRGSPHIAIRVASTRQAAIPYYEGTYIVTVFIRGTQEARDALIRSWQGKGPDAELNAFYRDTMGIQSVRLLGDPAQLWGKFDLPASQWPPTGLTLDVFWSSTYDGIADDEGLSVGWIVIVIAGMLLVTGVGTVLYMRRGIGKKEAQYIAQNIKENKFKKKAKQDMQGGGFLEEQLMSMEAIYDVEMDNTNGFDGDFLSVGNFSAPVNNTASRSDFREGKKSEDEVPAEWRLEDLETELAMGIGTHARARRIATAAEQARAKEEAQAGQQGIEEPILNHYIHRNTKKRLNEHTALFEADDSGSNNFSQFYEAGATVALGQHFSSTKDYISGESYGNAALGGRNNKSFNGPREEEIIRPTAFQWSPQPLSETLKIDEAFRLPPLRNPDGSIVKRTTDEDEDEGDDMFSASAKTARQNRKARKPRRFGGLRRDEQDGEDEYYDEGGQGAGGGNDEFELGGEWELADERFDLPEDEVEQAEAAAAQLRKQVELQRRTAASVFSEIKDGNLGFAARRRMHEIRDVQKQVVNTITLSSRGMVPRRDTFVAFDNRTAFTNPVTLSKFAYAASVFPTWNPLPENESILTVLPDQATSTPAQSNHTGTPPPKMSTSTTPPSVSLESTMRSIPPPPPPAPTTGQSTPNPRARGATLAANSFGTEPAPVTPNRARGVTLAANSHELPGYGVGHPPPSRRASDLSSVYKGVAKPSSTEASSASRKASFLNLK